MAKPSEVVEWPATGHIQEPPGAKKTEGWLGGNQPPAEFLNWLFNVLGQWSVYVNGFESTEVVTWALSQIFKRGITLGADWAASEAEAISPRLTVEPVSNSVINYTCVAGFNDFRLWQSEATSKQTVLTVNASHSTDNSNKWTKITNGQPAFALFVARTGLHVCMMPAAQDTAWSEAFVEGEGTTSGWGRTLFLSTAQSTQGDAEQDLPIGQHVANATSKRKLWWVFKSGSTQPIRLYYVRAGGTVGGGPGFQISINAEWDNSSNLWIHDVTGRCGLFHFGSDDFAVYTKPSAAANTTFADTVSASTWITPFVLKNPTATSGATDHAQGLLDNGHFKVTNTKSDDIDDANPPANTSQANKIGCRNVDKASCYAKTDGAGNITLQSGYNLENSGSVTMSGDEITVLWGTNFADANYECLAQVELYSGGSTTHLYSIVTYDKANNGVKARVYKTVLATGIGSVVDLDTEIVGVNFRASGVQTT